MAINFSQVKSLTIPEGDVKSISVGGVIVWQKNLPYELYENYYLTSHSYTYNTNYIDLGIKWNNNWKLEGKFYKPTTTSQWGRLLGTGYDTSSEVYVNYNAETNGDFVVNYGNTYVSQLSNANTINTEYNFSFGNRGSSCECWFKKPNENWLSFGTTWSPSNTNSTHNLRLFSNEQSDRDGIFGISKIQINGPSDLWSEAGALMLLVPARRKSDDVLGMYDKNNDVFYPVTTSGDGYFTITDVNGTSIWPQLFTITYRKAVYQNTLPASKTVPAGYVLTSADLPTQTDSSDWSVTGWTLNGTNTVSAGYVVNSNIELCAVHKYHVTSSNLFKRDNDDGTVSSSYGDTCSATASCGNVGNAATSGSTKTVAMTKKYSKTWSATGTFNSYKCGVTLGAWGGLVSTIQVDHACRMEWTPARSSVTFTLPSGYTNEYNYTDCYPGYVCRNNSTGAYITAYNQNNTNKITYNVSEPSSGTTNALYIQYGKVTGSSINYLAWRGGYYYTLSSGPSSKNMTCNTSTTTETVYFYTTPTNS